MRRAYLVALVLVGCPSTPPGRADVTAEELLRPVLVVGFGSPIEELRRARPALAASGWSSGARATWIDRTVERGLEVETDDGRVRTITVTFDPDDRSEAEERRVKRVLGRGIACGALPGGMTSFQPMLWRLDDGAGVTLLRKERVVQLRVEKPASASFTDALASCAPAASPPTR